MDLFPLTTSSWAPAHQVQNARSRDHHRDDLEGRHSSYEIDIFAVTICQKKQNQRVRGRSELRKVYHPNWPSHLLVNNALTILSIDPNAPKRGLSAYMFFAQVSPAPFIVFVWRDWWCWWWCLCGTLPLTLYRRIAIQSGTRTPISASVYPPISTPILFHCLLPWILTYRPNRQDPRWTMEEHER